MDIARAITIQFNILNAVYLFIGLIVIGTIVILGSMYLYNEYREYQRKHTNTNKKDWL